uniref:Fibronectin type-III domain-containing protein n=1 Tax=Leptobrachium leishanense TaxID=445787 RepID=A0A8C5QDQ7_9ANUR
MPKNTDMGVYLFRWGLSSIICIFNVKICRGFGACSGYVTIAPRSVVPVGSDVSIICVATAKNCPRSGSFLFTLNNDGFFTPKRWNQTAAQYDLYKVTEDQTINCFHQCTMGSYRQFVCWETLYVGYAPDRPTNVSCSSKEHSTVMTCTWEKGRKTLITTNFTVHVKNLQTSQYKTYSAKDSLKIKVNKTQDKDFEISVTAENALGRTMSEITPFQLEDRVIPVAPEITKTEIQNETFRVSIRWRNKTADTLRHCELSYHTLRRTDWISTGQQVLDGKENILFMEAVMEANALRVRCREEKGLGYWSDWSVPENISQTAPRGTFEVWRVLGPVYPNGHQEVTILIKTDGPEPPWAKKQGYRVVYKDREVEIPLQTCVESPCKTSVPKGAEKIFVTAYNAFGSSQPRSLFMHHDNDAFPAPRNLMVATRLLASIVVHWGPPTMSESELLWFVVQWEPEACGDKKQPNVSWQIVQKEESQYIITEAIEAGRRVTVSLFAVYTSGISKPSINYGFTQELKPGKGPGQMTVRYSGAESVIEWGEVPLCYRNGFVLHYTLYLRNLSSGSVTRSKSTVRYYSIKNLNPDQLHELCISASTIAGEGPLERCQFLQPSKPLHNYTGLLLGMVCAATVLASITVTLTFKKKIRARIKKYAILLVPKCLCEEYPHIENCEILKNLEKNLEAPVNNLSLADPEITEVEELTPEKPANPPALEYDIGIHEHVGLTEDADSAEIIFPEPTTGYRPQISKTNPLRSDSYCAPPHLLEIPRPGQSWDHANDCADQDVFISDCESGFDLLERGLLLSDVEDGDISRFFQAAPKESEGPGGTTGMRGLICDQQTLRIHGNIDFSYTADYFPQILAKGMQGMDVRFEG